jgi:HEAT repeat protein
MVLPKVQATAALFVLLSIFSSQAYFVSSALSLNEMEYRADLVVKAKVTGSAIVEDPSFKAIPGFACFATRLRIISVLKGDPGTNTITFRHYGRHTETNSWMIASFEPQHYELTDGRSYILFARKGVTNGEFLQLWMNHTMKSDEGAFRAADDLPVATKSVKEACWLTLVGMQASTNTEDVVYGLNQLDDLSGGILNEFPRKDVVELIRPHLSPKDQDILRTAVAVAGSRNPYLDPGRGPAFWLGSVGKGHFPSLGRTDPGFENLSGRLLWRELSALAETNLPTSIRCAAIKALGRSGVPELRPYFEKWTRDPEPFVRQAAIELLPDFSGPDSERYITNAAKDSSAEVRTGAALAVGFGQRTALIPMLEKLLTDESRQVRDAAAMSLLSFSPAESGEVMRKHIHDTEYRGLFVNALAIADPAPYLAELQKNIVTNPEPTNFWGGKMPSFDSWDILFQYVRSHSAEELQSGKLDRSLDALEKTEWFSSSEPRDLYALYLQRGLTKRAKAFREECKHTVHFDMEYYFNMVDQSPGTYQREFYD